LTRPVTFESEPGLVTPGILKTGRDGGNTLTIYVSDDGKGAEFSRHETDAPYGISLFLDILGTGELSEFDLRYSVYAGRSVAFTAGWQIAKAAELMRKYSDRIEIVGRGPISSQAVMFAALMEPKIAGTTGLDCPKTWEGVFKDGMPEKAIQPRAHLMGTLENLRKKVKNGEWKY
jgi:hypothetical protein